MHIDDLSRAHRVDEICDAFEQKWRSGDRPLIETFLAADNGHPPSDLLCELVVLDLEYRSRMGETPSFEEYAARFPEAASTIREAFHKAHDVSTRGFSPPSHPAANAGYRLPDVGRLQLIERIGQGSFGTVWRAYDPELDRVVAVKLPRPGLVTTRAEEDRFLREARSAAQLVHPGIVSIYDCGRSSDSVYIVAEFVDGRTLKETLAERSKRNPREAATLIASICDALEYAHLHKVIHRDLKPSNVVLQPVRPNAKGNDLQQCIPRILDFGLALRAEADATITEDGQILGTPAYMSPEQARGEGHHADCRTDIYSLGVMLYQMLTGCLPHSGTSHQMIQSVIEHDAVHVRQLDQGISKDLATICHKCLRKNRVDRYASAADLAADLRSWLEGRPVLARPAPVPEKVIRWCRRRPVTVGLVGALLAICIVATAVFAWQRRANLDARATLAQRVVDNLLTATPDRQSELLAEVRQVLDLAEPELRRRLEDDNLPTRDRALMLVALLPREPLLMGELHELALGGAGEGLDLRLLADELASSADRLRPMLWESLSNSRSADDRQWLSAAALLAKYDPASSSWPEVARELALRMADSEDVETWIAMFEPIRSHLVEPLAQLFLHASLPLRRESSALAIAAYLSDDMERLAEFALDCDGVQFGILVDALRSEKSAACARLMNRLQEIESTLQDESASETGHRRMANAGLALIALEDSPRAWRLFRHNPDPRTQTYLIHMAHQRLPLETFVNRVYMETDPGSTYAMLLAISNYFLHADPADRVAEPDQAFEDWLWKEYRDHPDAGVHSAIRYLLQQWGATEALQEVDLQLAQEHAPLDRDWYHNRLGQMMIVVRRSGSATTGFAIAATETTRAHFQQLHLSVSFDSASEPHQDLPIGKARLWEAVLFCRSLSEAENLRSNQMSLLLAGEGDFDKGMVPLQVDLTRPGYRLPTDDEWEYACRAGTDTDRFHGGMDTPWLEAYTWCNRRAASKRVASLMPNQLGLFDTFGNLYEWTITERVKIDGTAVAPLGMRYDLGSCNDRVLFFRGGSFGTEPNYIYSANRNYGWSGEASPARGFRIARSLE